MKTKAFLCLLAIAALAGLSSCQTTSSSAAPSDAVMCPKCQMVAFHRTGTINKQLTIISGEKMVCAECKSMAENFFSKTHTLKHTCSTCGAALVHCTAH